MKHYNIHVSGKVQGVCFRKFTQQKAIALGLKGFVRNQADGKVFIEVEGEENSLQQFVSWCHRGPELAHVDNVVIEEEALVNYTEFVIRY